MPMSKFTQHYPPKFARTIAKVMLHEIAKPHVIFAQEDEDQHPTKKRRLGQKSSPQQIAERFQRVSWQVVMQEADKVAPRVGIKVLEQGALIALVKRMCPQHDVQHVVLCRVLIDVLVPTKLCKPLMPHSVGEFASVGGWKQLMWKKNGNRGEGCHLKPCGGKPCLPV